MKYLSVVFNWATAATACFLAVEGLNRFSDAQNGPG